jgi:malate dehydrogenase (oxaloacetate-decarboxylating)/malate dehydrogenase (oxaloacetate-decarboxylating)(NADP+)
MSKTRNKMSTKITTEEALHYHEFPVAGKLSVQPTKRFKTQRDLSLAYSPGVGDPCLEIQKNPDDIYRYTIKGNLVGVISNGTAVLGLGNLGAAASKPVMEGKSILFKRFGKLDAFDVEVDAYEVDKFCEVVEAIAPTFGGINLEDIKAPECFEIEERLDRNCKIPVMHDDQHGTAVISTAGLINACDITDRKIEEIKIVIVGAGAAAIRCAQLYKEMGATTIYMIDSSGLITEDRENLSKFKREFAAPSGMSRDDVFTDEDMVLGLSAKGGFESNDILKMKKDPIIFACANPYPEMMPEEIQEVRRDAVIATGRSDFPNQINNVLGFPFIFRGAMDVRANTVTTEMKLAAAKALADLTKKPVLGYIEKIYKTELEYGREYFIPKPFDNRLLIDVSLAVAKAAWEQGNSKLEYFHEEQYKADLSRIVEDNLVE